MPPHPETTPLTPAQDRGFQRWLDASQIHDNDHPDSHYDYRGLFLALQGQPVPMTTDRHFPDTFKTHGHPTFSVESQYSRGPWDGASWLGDQPIAPPMASHPPTAAPAAAPAPFSADLQRATAGLLLGH